VVSQGGRVGVDSKPGQGSAFFAVLPREASVLAERAPPRQSEPPGPAEGPAVLVIEDEPRDREWLAMTLTRAGYNVQTASTGAAAIAACEARTFRAITLDLLLPDLGGWQVLRAIRERPAHRDVPVVVVTVAAEQERAIGFRVHAFLLKPCADDDVIHALTRVCSPHDGARGARTVLAVDDDEDSLRKLKTTLDALGYQVAIARNGADALAAAQKNPPAVVVVDLLTSSMNAFDFLAHLRATEAGRAAAVIVWTEKRLSTDERRKLRELAQVVLSKSEGGTAALLAELRSHVVAARSGFDGR
jgi:CheY-like chemotaxis protein